MKVSGAAAVAATAATTTRVVNTHTTAQLHPRPLEHTLHHCLPIGFGKSS